LASELPVITDFLWITGPGANLLTVRRDTGGDYGIFTCVAAQLNISGLAIANGGGPQFEGEGAVSNSMKQEATGRVRTLDLLTRGSPTCLPVPSSREHELIARIRQCGSN
jgi:hypothetical protein